MFKRLLSFLIGLTRLIGKINIAIMLAIIYILIFTPTGLVLRLFRRNKPTQDSQWIKREIESDLERQF